VAVKEIPAKLVAELRARTGAGMMDCKRALEETGGDLDKAVELLRTKSIAKADRRAAHQATEGLIDAYVHFNGKVAVLIELNCETDFVARTDAFRQLARDLALHVASQAPLAVKIEDLPTEIVDSERRIYEAQAAEQKKPPEIRAKIVEGMLRKFYEERVLFEQKFVKDDTRTVGELVRGLAAQTGENIQVRRFARFELGGE
jgi:elongation factor Ts